MQRLLLFFAVPLLLCFGNVFVCAEGEKTTRDTLLKANENTVIAKHLRPNNIEYVHSYHFPSLVEVQGLLCVVAEARYDNQSPHHAGQVVAKCTEDRGKSWRMIVGVPSGTWEPYARSVYPTVVQHEKKLLIFAETFEKKLVDRKHYKIGNGEFLYFPH